LGVRPRTFAIGFQGSGESEHLFARQVAQHLGCEHQEEVLAPEIIGLTRQVVEAMDEPNGDTSCLPTYLLCRSARRQVAVSLSGDGADELFLGYPRYFATLEQARRRGGLSPAEHYLAAAGPLLLSPETVGSLLGGLPPYLEGILASWNALLCDERQSLVHRLRALDADTYLPGAVLAKVDRMSMRFALEVRSPFLDREVADFAAGCAPSWCYHAGQGKAILKDLGVKYLPRPWLERPKTGFGIPTDFWRPAELAAWARELLLASDAKLGGHLARLPLTRLLERLARPGQIHVQRFWPLLVLELWLRSL
jgi:asparagine synthase (glutamine-hydrolysing)